MYAIDAEIQNKSIIEMKTNTPEEIRTALCLSTNVNSFVPSRSVMRANEAYESIVSKSRLLNVENTSVRFEQDSNIDALIIHVETNLESFKVYPNPVNSILNIEVKNCQSTEIMIYNLSGILVKSLSVNASTAINVSELTKGMYIIKFSSNNGTEITKFIKE